MTKAPRLSARALGLALPAGRPLVTRLELELAPGEILAVIGPNGAGKTTLLRTLAGLRAASEGSGQLDARPLSAVPDRERARAIAYLPQGGEVPAALRVDEVVMLGRAPHQSWWGSPGAEDRRAVAEAMTQCEVETLGARRIGTLSGGERQRVMLARMMATRAPLLILDEPTTALDVGHALRCFELLTRFAAEGHAVVIAVHELEQVRRFADRVLCLHGDAEGGWTLGAVDKVLRPEILDRVFKVRTRAEGERLHFDLPESASLARD